MKDFKSNDKNIKTKEDDISASNADKNAGEKPVDDAFKTPNRKYKQEWTQPLDEQQFDDTDLSAGKTGE